MSKLHKSKQYDRIGMFNDTSRYLDDIFIIDNPEFEINIKNTERCSKFKSLETRQV